MHVSRESRDGVLKGCARTGPLGMGSFSGSCAYLEKVGILGCWLRGWIGSTRRWAKRRAACSLAEGSAGEAVRPMLSRGGWRRYTDIWPLWGTISLTGAQPAGRHSRRIDDCLPPWWEGLLGFHT